MSNILLSPILMPYNPVSSGQFPRPPWLGGCARLAQPLQRVTRAPFFLHLAPSNAMNEDGRYFDLLASGRHAHSLTSIVGAAPPAAGHDLVAFGDLILDGDLEVREGGTVLGEAPLVALAVLSLARKHIAINEVGSQHFVYRALEYPRTFRSPIYVLIYEVACGWCGRADMIEPDEINATVGNPASQRHQYDIYACHACDRYTAVSYLGQVFAYPASQDDRYPSMYYLEVEEA